MASHYAQLYIPLRLLGSISMMLAVGLTLVVCSTVVYYSQLQSMRNFTLDSGSSLAKLIAIDSAEAILSEDWIAIEILVEDLKNYQEFSYIFIVDHKGIVRASNDNSKVNHPLTIDGLPDFFVYNGESKIRDWKYQGSLVFDFEVPVKFQKKQVGNIHIGLSQSTLLKAASTTLWMMALLTIITVAAVVGMTYLLFSRITRPITLLNFSINQACKGYIKERLNDERADEFGEIFKSFNHLLDSMQQKTDKVETSLTHKFDSKVVPIVLPSDSKTNTDTSIETDDKTILLSSLAKPANSKRE